MFKNRSFKSLYISGRALREIIVIIVILAISVYMSLPTYFSELKDYKKQQKEELNISTPEKEGMDQVLLSEAVDYVGKTDACSFVVVRHGKIVLEKYFNGFDKETYTNVYSVTKSVMSALTGIAIDQGYIKGVDEKAADFFPEYYNVQSEPLKKQITIKHLLTMTPGFVEDLNTWRTSKNLIESAVNLPLKFKPGEEFQYANSATHLLSGILTKATKMSAMEFAGKNLFGPLNMAVQQWSADPQGYNIGPSELYLTPRSMAKFGLLYLNNGVWEGKQVVPLQWVKESIRKWVDFDRDKTDKSNPGYGYLWWMRNEGSHFVYFASGYGGQYICIIPDLDIVVVVTSLPDRQLSFTDDNRRYVLANYVIPAAK